MVYIFAIQNDPYFLMLGDILHTKKYKCMQKSLIGPTVFISIIVFNQYNMNDISQGLNRLKSFIEYSREWKCFLVNKIN